MMRWNIFLLWPYVFQKLYGDILIAQKIHVESNKYAIECLVFICMVVFLGQRACKQTGWPGLEDMKSIIVNLASMRNSIFTPSFHKVATLFLQMWKTSHLYKYSGIVDILEKSSGMLVKTRYFLLKGTRRGQSFSASSKNYLKPVLTYFCFKSDFKLPLTWLLRPLKFLDFKLVIDSCDL